VSAKRKGEKPIPRPQVLACFCMTVDGKTVSRKSPPGADFLFAGRNRMREVLDRADAVLMEHEAVDFPDQVLFHEARGGGRKLLRGIVSNTGKLDPSGKDFTGTTSPPVIFSTRRMPVCRRAEMARKSDLFLFPGREVNLCRVLEILRAEFGVKRVVCGGGGPLMKSLAALDLVDGILLSIAPMIFGGWKVPTLAGLPGAFLDPPREFEILRTVSSNEGCFLELRRRRGVS